MFSHFVLVCQLLDVSYGLQLYVAVGGVVLCLVFLDKTNSSNIWVGGDFNLGNIDWSIPSFITGKPDAFSIDDVMVC
jgi:hypothetical protein